MERCCAPNEAGADFRKHRNKKEEKGIRKSTNRAEREEEEEEEEEEYRYGIQVVIG